MKHSVAALVDDRTVGDVIVPPAFDSFYRLEFPRLVDLAYALSGSRMAAEDLVQEAMIVAHRDWARVGLLDKPGAWVRRVVLNLSASLYHRRVAEIRALRRMVWLRGEPPAQLDPDSAEFWDTLRKLPKRQTEAVALHYLDGYSVTEIAEVMGCAESTVKVHLHRARKTLSVLLRLEEDQ